MRGKRTIDRTEIAALNKFAYRVAVLPSHLAQLQVDDANKLPTTSSRLAYKRQMQEMQNHLNTPLTTYSFDLRWKEYAEAAKKALATSNLASVLIDASKQSSGHVEQGSVIPLISSSVDKACISGTVGGSKSEILCDLGASGQFMGINVAKRLGLKQIPISSAVINIDYAKENVGDHATHYATTRVRMGTY